MTVTRSLCAAAFALTAFCASAHAADFTLQSSLLEDNGLLDAKYTGNNPANPNCVGQNVSPPLAWSNAPAGAKSFALIALDVDGQAGIGVVHLVAYGVKADVASFAEGAISAASDVFVSGKNTPGTPGWFGPCPPAGSMHHYNVTIIASDLAPDALAPGLTRDELLGALKGHALRSATLVMRRAHP